jgi:Putative Ig domain.
LIVTTTLPDAVRTQPYTALIDQTGANAPFSFAVVSGALPPGLTLSAAGAISGTPTALGSYTFDVRLTDAHAMRATTMLTIRVFEPVSVTPITLTEGAVNQAFTATVSASGGFAPYGWALAGGTLPTGVSLSPAGVVSGTPTQSGAFTFTATATDAASRCKWSRVRSR